jgi:hypothetical protein
MLIQLVYDLQFGLQSRWPDSWSLPGREFQPQFFDRLAA